MAALGSWPGIRKQGLLSTSRLLDLFEVAGIQRIDIESKHRPEIVRLSHDTHGEAFVRDQKPMSDRSLRDCLQDNLSPSDWYKILNSKVFFWVTKERLLRMLKAKAYRAHAHDVLVLDARSLVRDCAEQIWLSPINSGASIPWKHQRGLSTFVRLRDYPFEEWGKRRGSSGEPVVELAVDGAVQNIERYVLKVVKMTYKSTHGRIWPID